MISKYNATYTQEHYFSFKEEKHEKQTLIERVGNLIDSEWKHSWHWETKDYKWIEQAKKSLSDEQSKLTKRSLQLKEADRLLSMINIKG